MSRKVPLLVALVVTGVVFVLSLLTAGAWLALAEEEYEATTKVYVGTDLDLFHDPDPGYNLALGLVRDCIRQADHLITGAAVEAVPETALFEVTARRSSASEARQSADTWAERAVVVLNDPETGCSTDDVTVLTTIVDRAPLPADPASPDPARTLLAAGTLGLLGGAALGGLSAVVLRRRQ